MYGGHGNTNMNKNLIFEKALKDLNVSGFVYRGPVPENEEQFNNVFRKIIGQDSEQIGIESSNPDDFGVNWSEINEKIKEIRNAQPLKELREERNRRIALTDWRFRSDLSPSQEWRDYCVALRDLPANYSPTFDIVTEDDYPLVKEDNTTPWPEEPNDG